MDAAAILHSQGYCRYDRERLLADERARSTLEDLAASLGESPSADDLQQAIDLAKRRTAQADRSADGTD